MAAPWTFSTRPFDSTRRPAGLEAACRSGTLVLTRGCPAPTSSTATSTRTGASVAGVASWSLPEHAQCTGPSCVHCTVHHSNHCTARATGLCRSTHGARVPVAFTAQCTTQTTALRVPQVAGKYASFLSCTFTLNVAQVLDCRTLPDGFYVCGGGGGIYLGSRVTEPLTIASTVFTRNTGMYGGALQITAGPESTVSNCTFEHNNGVQGGGLYVAGGVSILTLTTLKNNDCKAEGAYAIDDCGKNVQPVSGILLYLLPVPAGHWLPNADCVVNRIGCPLGDKLCSDTRATCSLTAGQVASGRTAHHARRTLGGALQITAGPNAPRRAAAAARAPPVLCP